MPISSARGSRPWRSPRATSAGRVQAARRRCRTACNSSRGCRSPAATPTRRFLVLHDELGPVLRQLAARLARRGGAATAIPSHNPPVPAAALDRLAEQLWQARGRSLVLCGSQDVEVRHSPSSTICSALRRDDPSGPTFVRTARRRPAASFVAGGGSRRQGNRAVHRWRESAV